MNSKYYFHGTRKFDTAENIILNGAIYSPDHDGVEGLSLFNGKNQICVSEFVDNDKRLGKEYEFAMIDFSVGHIVFMINDEGLEIERPILVTSQELFMNDEIYQDSDNPLGYTNYFDEYRVKNSIPLKNIVAIGYPLDKKLRMLEVVKARDVDEYNEKLSTIFCEIKRLKNLMLISKKNCRIFDSSDLENFYMIKDISKLMLKCSCQEREYSLIH